MGESHNTAVDMVDRNVAQGRSGKVAFIDPTRKLTYGELAEQSARVGPMLARLGLRREDRVAMMALDTVDFPMLYRSTRGSPPSSTVRSWKIRARRYCSSRPRPSRWRSRRRAAST
jgi:hypothetical protein